MEHVSEAQLASETWVASVPRWMRFSMISRDGVDGKEVAAPGIGNTAAIGLVESPPNNEGLSYIMDGLTFFFWL
jgi:hypothetical protein